MNPEETIKSTSTQKPKTLNIHKMKLHEKIIIRDMYITRVAGGWIYDVMDEDGRSITFVPYSNEFFSEQ